MDTALNNILGIEHPLLLAPMGNVSGGALAAAVTRAGGLGLIGGGYGDADWLAREFAAAGDERVGVGFITWSLARQPELLDQALAHEPAAVMFSFGDCRPYLPTIRQAGAKIICQVQTLAQACEAAESGADVIVAQGTEGGGHGGSRSTFTFVPAVVDAVAPTPVVAAGGIADGRGLAAALMLGAAGVLVGTRLFASAEALGHANIKSAIAQGTGDATLRTRVFDIVRGYPWPEHITGRAVLNDFAAYWHGREAALHGALEHQQAVFRRATAQGDTDNAVIFSGEAMDLIHSVEPAQAIVKQIMTQARDLMGNRTL